MENAAKYFLQLLQLLQRGPAIGDSHFISNDSPARQTKTGDEYSILYACHFDQESGFRVAIFL